jgi:hypothetical protein
MNDKNYEVYAKELLCMLDEIQVNLYKAGNLASELSNKALDFRNRYDETNDNTSKIWSAKMTGSHVQAELLKLGVRLDYLTCKLEGGLNEQNVD